MNLIVGLGNPGKKYENNRHNIGFKIVDSCYQKWNIKELKEYNFLFGNNEDSVFIKPTTYMNLSGNAVYAATKKYSIEDILVIVDDVNLPFGEIRFREKGGDGGHNGIKSIIETLGSNEFKRMRIGVGNSEEKILSDYVLEDFSKKELEMLQATMDFSTDLLLIFNREGYQRLLNYYSINKIAYSESISRIQNL